MNLLQAKFFFLIGYFIWLAYICCLIQVTTTIGFGSPNKANSYSVHGSALGAKEVDATRKNLGWPHEPFYVPEDVKKYLHLILNLSLNYLCLSNSILIWHPPLNVTGTGVAIPLKVLLWKLNGMPNLQSMRRNTKKKHRN